MSKLRIVRRDDTPCLAPIAKEGDTYKMVPVDADVDPLIPKVREFHPGSETELALFEASLPPSMESAPHAHVIDEIFYIVEGEMVIGSHTLKPGDSVYVTAETLYGYKAGPQGVRYLTFHPRRDNHHQLSKEDVAERKRRRADASSAS